MVNNGCVPFSSLGTEVKIVVGVYSCGRGNDVCEQVLTEGRMGGKREGLPVSRVLALPPTRPPVAG